MDKTTKREIGYWHTGGHKPGASISGLDVTQDEIERVAVGIGIAVGHIASVVRLGDSTSFRITSDDKYRGLGGGALRETQEYDARHLRDVAKEAIRAAGFKPVRL